MSSLLNTQGVLCRFSVAHSSLVTCPVNSRDFHLPDITAPSSQLKETTRCYLGSPSLWHDRTSSLGLKPRMAHLIFPISQESLSFMFEKSTVLRAVFSKNLSNFFSCLRWEGKSDLLFHLYWNRKAIISFNTDNSLVGKSYWSRVT